MKFKRLSFLPNKDKTREALVYEFETTAERDEFLHQINATETINNNEYKTSYKENAETVAYTVLPELNNPQHKKDLIEFLKVKYPDGYDFDKLLPVAPARLAQAKQRFSEAWAKIKQNALVTGIQESAAFKFMAAKLNDFGAWLSGTSIAIKFQQALANLRAKRDQIMAYGNAKMNSLTHVLQQKKESLAQKVNLLKEWFNFLAHHVKSYCTQVARDPIKWGAGFIQFPSRYPATMSILTTAVMLTALCGISVMALGGLAGGAVFAAAHFRNYCLQQRNVAIKEVDLERGDQNKPNESYLAGKEIKTWADWRQSFKQAKAWGLDHAAGREAIVQEQQAEFKRANKRRAP